LLIALPDTADGPPRTVLYSID